MKNNDITLQNIFRRFKLKISFTMVMALAESVILLLFPFFIGFAINDLLNSKNAGLINLGLLGIVSLVTGAVRRFFDTRAYAHI
jgi:uncharacterized membrane protein (DUF485 family)